MDSKEFVNAIPDLSQDEREALYQIPLKFVQHAHVRSLSYNDLRFKGKFLISVASKEMAKAPAPQSPRSPKEQICPITKLSVNPDGITPCCIYSKRHPQIYPLRTEPVRAPTSQHETIHQELINLLDVYKVAAQNKDWVGMGELGVEILQTAELISNEVRRSYQFDMLALMAEQLKMTYTTRKGVG